MVAAFLFLALTVVQNPVVCQAPGGFATSGTVGYSGQTISVERGVSSQQDPLSPAGVSVEERDTLTRELASLSDGHLASRSDAPVATLRQRQRHHFTPRRTRPSSAVRPPAAPRTRKMGQDHRPSGQMLALVMALSVAAAAFAHRYRQRGLYDRRRLREPAASSLSGEPHSLDESWAALQSFAAGPVFGWRQLTLVASILIGLVVRAGIRTMLGGGGGMLQFAVAQLISFIVVRIVRKVIALWDRRGKEDDLTKQPKPQLGGS